jgi:hypothetical protein
MFRIFSWIILLISEVLKMLESGHFPRDRTSKNIKRYYESATDVKLLKRIVYNCKKKKSRWWLVLLQGCACHLDLLGSKKNYRIIETYGMFFSTLLWILEADKRLRVLLQTTFQKRSWTRRWGSTTKMRRNTLVQNGSLHTRYSLRRYKDTGGKGP